MQSTEVCTHDNSSPFEAWEFDTCSMEQVFFQWQDYLILAIVLAISAAIGFYYACTGGRQKTTREYLFADNDMHWLPVSCSLVARYV